MKKIILTLLLLIAVGVVNKLCAQWYFYESFNYTTIDATGTGDIPSTFTLYNDKNTPNSTIPDYSHFNKAWKVVMGLDADGAAASISYFKEEKPADRWMITPSISLSNASSPQLYFKAKSEDDVNRDGFVVRLSTTTKDSSAFTTVLKTVRQAKGSWTEHVIDLSDYKGKDIHIAFIQNSSNKYLIYIDEIRVAEKANTVSASCNGAFVPMYMVFSGSEQKKYPVTATIQNWSSEQINKFRFCYRVDGGEVFSKVFEGLSIPSMGTSTVSLDYEPLKYGKVQNFEIWFDQINGTNFSTESAKNTSYVVGDADVPYKKLMLEGFSSLTCVNCGPQNAVLHKIVEKYFGNNPSIYDGFVICKYQVNIPVAGDPAVTSETEARRSYYGIIGAPTWYINGKNFSLGEEEEETARFVDTLKSFRKTVSPLFLSIKLTRSDSKFTVETKIEGKLPCIGKYKLYVNLLEDSIHHRTSSMSGENDVFSVVRKMLPDQNGTQIKVPALGEVVNHTLSYTFDGENPKIFSDLSGISAVAFLQNTETNEIIQATFSYPDFGWTNNEGRNDAVNNLKIYPNPAKSQATLMFDSKAKHPISISITNMQGKMLYKSEVNPDLGSNQVILPVYDLSNGQYIVRIESKLGVSVAKLLKN